MTTCVYRLTVYQERALQSNLATEPDVLAPAGGAAHSDDFKVATATGVSGFQPYLEMPEGRTSKLDRLNRAADQGQMTFTVIDKRTTEGGSNLSRWFTAFLSVLKPGCKVLCEESEDGAAYTTWWTGRVEAIALDGRNALRLRCRDMLSDLARHEVFGGRPHSGISYAAEPLLLPLGLSADFGTQQATPLLSGTINTDGVFRTIALDGSSKGRKENVITRALIRAAGIPLGKVNVPLDVRASANLRVRFTAGAVTQKEGIVTKLEVQRRAKHFQVNKVWLRTVDSDDPYYTALDTGTIADAASVTSLSLRQRGTAEGGGDTPLLLDGIRGPEMIQDLLDGSFGLLNDDGTVNRAFPYNAANFTTMTADATFPLLRYVISGPKKLKEFVEKEVLPQSGLGWRVNAAGEVVLVDLRPLSASPTSTTITEADLADGTVPEWELNRDRAVNIVRCTTYLDMDRDADALGEGYVPEAPTTLLESAEVIREVQVGDNYDLGTKRLEIDCTGFRTFANETLNNQDRAQVIDRDVEALAAGYRAFGAGLIVLTLLCARTSNTDCQVGDWRLIDVDMLPDPGTNLRGGTRLMQCIERTDQPRQGLVRRLRFEDAGLNAVATAPTVGTPAQETSNTQHGLTVTVTLNASSELALLYVNTTATSVGTRPADTAAGWRLITPVGQIDPYIRATGSVTCRPLPGGLRHWVAVATAPVIGTKLMSVRAYPAGTGYVDTAALTAPNTAAIGSVSTKAGLLTWSNNSDDVSGVEVWLASGTSEVNAEAATPVRYRLLPPGTTAYQLTALDTTLPELGTAGPWYYPQVKHADGYGGYSTAAEIAGVSFEATGSATTAPDMAAVVVTRDLSNSPYPGSAGGLAPVGESGIELKLVAAPTGLGLDIELERAPDSGGSPGTYAQIAKIPQIGAVAQLYRDKLSRDGLTYWYRARLSGGGVSAGGYATAVSASPGWLPLVAFGVELPDEPVLGQTETRRYPAIDFQSATSSDAFLRGAALVPETTATTFVANFGIPLEPGVTITGFRARMHRQGASDVATAKLVTYDESGSTTDGNTLTASTGAGYNTQTDPGGGVLPITLDGTITVNARFDLKGNTVTTDAGALWVEVDFTRNSYRQ